ncbi:MAG: hypothetical protein KC649_03270, partial [Candidatus Omnitrophica bacterium]|nr:hypothetical protein [Candidatus Omnitrophota bacterium]
LHGLPIVQGYLGRKIGMPLAARLPYEPKNLAIQKQLLKQNRVKYIIIHKRKAAFNASKPQDLMVYLKLDRLSKEYAKVYPVLYEDEFAASFEVY